MSPNEKAQLDAIQDVREQLRAVLNEALTTHGPALTMTAVVTFAATACHHAAHLMDAPNARELARKSWDDGFYGYLKLLEAACDG